MNIQKSNYIVCIAQLIVKEEYLDEVLKIFTELKQSTSTEPGCIRYELHQSQDNYLLFTFIDRFKSMEAFEYHCKQEIVIKYFDNILPTLTKSMEFTLHNEISIKE
jgi:quinol monooxygenase YgiN